MKLKASIILSALLLFSGFVFSAPLSGTYTIGGSSPSYATFTAAVNALTENGVSGAVTFNVRNGVYTEQFIIPAITGASSSNTITFQSQSGVASDVTLEFNNTSANNYVIEFNGASYITIQNLTITSLDATNTYGQLIYFYNANNYSNTISCNYINILNNNLIGLPQEAYPNCSNYAVVVVAIIPGTGLHIEGNTISNGTQSVQWLGNDNTTNGIMNCSIVKNNIMQNAGEWTMAIAYQNNSILEGNTFSSNLSLNLGMQIQDVVNPLLIANNKFTYSNTICALYIVNNHPADLNHSVIVANNFFSMTSANAMELINDEYSQFYFNSAYCTGGAMAFVDYGNSDNSILADNIFYQASGNPVLNIATGAVSSCDYNDFYSTGATLAQWNSNNEATLANWQAASGFDTHSKSILPPFNSFSNLHLTSYTSMQFGIPVAGFPADIDNFYRGNPPAVGAADTGTVLYTPPPSTCCGCTQPAFGASATSVCQGSIVNFIDESSDSPTGWQWTFAGGTPGSSTNQNPTVTYDTVGTFTVKLVVTTRMGTDSVIQTGYITVNASPATGTVALSKNAVCAGDSSQLTVTGSAGTIQWQSSVAPAAYTDIASADSSIYNTGPLFQTASYRWVVSQGVCTDTSAPVSVTVNQPPTPPVLSTADSLICANDSTQIISSGSYPSYLWNNGDTTNYAWANSAGGFWVTVTDVNGCTAVSGHQEISVYPVPSVSITVQGDTLSSFGEVSYQWYFNSDSIPGAINPTYIASQSGNYSVGITDTNGCKALSNSTYVTITSVSQLMEGSLLSIYPDPFNNTIFIKEDEAGTVIQHIKIYDVLGRIALDNKYNNSAPLILPVDVSALSPGAYYIRVETNLSGYNRSIIKN